MSGCCGQGPVIISGAAATPRLDVETVVLCDVLADGSVAGVALVEPIYDTNTGDRLSTRTVDPVTGAAYTPSGTLQPCQPDGCNATTAAQVLCDEATDGTVTHFVRATTYDCEGALLGTLDRTLDGDAYTVAGTVGVCPASPDCESSTTPVTAVGLCLADGTPIAVTVVRDCTSAITSEGWLNLTSGAWSAGAVPAGTVACGESRSIQVSGTFCDVDDATGDVLGLVLVEYTYDDTGAIASVRLVDAVTGDTYTPAGTVTVCPAGVEQPERDLLQLCDTATDGTVTAFVRDYARDENGAIVGHSDYGLDGAPYTSAGTVGSCSVEPCRNSTTVMVCDAPADSSTSITPTIVDGVAADVGQTQFQNHPGPYTALWSGGTFIYPAGAGPAQEHLIAVGQLTADTVGCDGAAGTLTISVHVRNDGPAPGQQWDGALRLFRGTTALATQNALLNAPVGWEGTLTVSAPVTAADLAAGDIRVALMLETYHLGAKQWTADQFTVSLELEGCEATSSTQFLRTLVTDCETGEVVSTTDTTLDGTPYTVTGEVGQCTPASNADECRDCEHTVLCDVTADEGTRSFLRTVCRDCTGAVVSVLDTELDGATAYAAAGTVGVCAEPCRTTFSQILCEGGGPQTYVSAITNRATDRARAAAPGPTLGDLDLAPLFAGGSVTSEVPAAGSVAQVQYYGAGDITLPAGEPCGPPDTVEVSFTARFTNNGPGIGQATTVFFALLNGTTIVANNGAAGGNPGQSFTRVVTASVPTADILAGNITLGLYIEGVQNNQRQSWTIDQWDMTIKSTSEIPGCGGTKFRRTFVMDCDSGEVTGHFDTTLDGQPYSAVNAVGLCPDSDSTGDECRDCEQTVLCDVTADEGTRSFLRTVCRDCTGAVVSVLDTALDGTSPYTAAGTVGRCCDTQVVAECTYSLPDTPTRFSLTDPAYPDCWVGTAGAPSYAYGDRVTSWAATYQSDTDSASVALFSSPDLGGAINFAAFTPALPVNPAQSAAAYTGTAVINGVTVTLTATAGNGLGIWQANNTGLYLGGGDGFRLDFSQPVRLTINTSGFADPPSLHERFCGVTAETVPWPALKLADCNGNITTLDAVTRELLPAGAVLECQAPGGDPCETTSVQTVRLCDLDPTVEADADGRRCAVPFLRHLAYDCAGDLFGFHDTGLDGTTPYTPVQVVDCQCESGEGLTSTIEVPWQVVSVVEDPAGLPRQDFIYTVSPENDPTRIGTIRVHVSRQAGAPCATYDINNLVFSNTSAYTLTLDAVAQEMSYLRVDLLDFDTFEPVAINTTYPLPTRLGGTAGWNAAHTRIVPSENDGTGYMYWDAPPATVGWSVLNQGGGTSCSALRFQGMTVEPGGCCGGEGGCSDCGPVDTGVRAVTGTAAQDLAAEFPDLQSVSLAVLAGTVNVTMSDGGAVPIPAGVTLTWSVSKDTDTALAAASFAGADPSASYLLNWTYLS